MVHLDPKVSFKYINGFKNNSWLCGTPSFFFNINMYISITVIHVQRLYNHYSLKPFETWVLAKA